MANKNISCTMVAAVIMLLVPYLVNSLIVNMGFDPLGTFIVLFYVVNPLTAIGIGVYSGMSVKSLWIQPLFVSVLFLAGMSILFGTVAFDFIYYAQIYLILGYFAMLFIAWWMSREK